MRALVLIFWGTFLFAEIDLEENLSDFVLQTKQIILPGYKEAFHPSIVPWEDSFLLSFRILPNPKNTFVSQIGLVKVDRDFNPVGEPQLLDVREFDSIVPSRAEDARLINIGDRIYMIYSDNINEKLTGGGFRLFVAEIVWDCERFFLKSPVCLARFEGESQEVREKNWVPFEFMGELLLAYSLNPHKIFRPDLLTGDCQTIACTEGEIYWDWGTLRGGTPALKIGDEYISFFHSSKKIETVHSTPRRLLHYVMGAYTFSLHHPFKITRISPEPIIGENFYRGPFYSTYKNWSSVRGVFPCGLIMDDEAIWVTYGKQDHEMWVVKLDQKKLLESLVPVADSYERD